MSLNKQSISLTPLPKIEDVILKVKQLQELTPQEELVYLICIEEVPEAEALRMIEGNIDGNSFASTSDNQPF